MCPAGLASVRLRDFSISRARSLAGRCPGGNLAGPCLVLGEVGEGREGEATAVARLGTDIVCFGQEHGLNFQRLLDASGYKEAYRRDMILWGEARRQADPGFFCRKVVEGVSQPVWVRVPRGSMKKTPFLQSSPFPKCDSDVSISPSSLPPPMAQALTIPPRDNLVAPHWSRHQLLSPVSHSQSDDLFI